MPTRVYIASRWMSQQRLRTRVYIASRWMSQQRLREVVKTLPPEIEVVSSWLYAVRDAEPTKEFFRQHGMNRAQADLADLDRANFVVLDLLDGRGRRGGMMFEAGYAHARHKPVYVVGEPDCVFTQLFQSFASWNDLIKFLKGR